MDWGEGERFGVILLGVVVEFGGEVCFRERRVEGRVFGILSKGILGGKVRKWGDRELLDIFFSEFLLVREDWKTGSGLGE